MHHFSPHARRTALKLFTATTLNLLALQVQADCDLNATIAAAVQICDSGTSGPLSKPGGDNTLIFPRGGTGEVFGSISFAAGRDSVEMDSARVNGNFNQGAGNDTFRLTSGTIVGDVNQGQGIDDFFISGGSLRTLTQGDARDNFVMTGGNITMAFEDGDVARMTGGTIGRVDMKLDDNLFDMAGGTIFNNLVTGFGRDTIILSGGIIGGAISVSGGNDIIILSGGEVGGGIRASFGDDVLDWRDAGIVRTTILMADGNDRANLTNLNETSLGATSLLDGGPGNDLLVFRAVATSVPGRYSNWERIDLSQASVLKLDGELVLGDASSATGVLNVDQGSTLASSAGTVRSLAPEQRAILNNAGTLDLTDSAALTDTLTVNGNYAGRNGRLLLQAVLGDDAASSDRLIVSQGSLSGSTQIEVSNVGGTGAVTRQNGIQVVQARNGAISEDTAFSLGHTLSAGAYDYYLFKGGVTTGSEQSWFLRSTVVALPAPAATAATPEDSAADPAAPVTPGETAPSLPAAIAPVAAPGTPALPVAKAGAAAIVLYRPEVPNYAVVPAAAAALTLASLGTFHERRGDQSSLTGTGLAPAGWGRTFGRHFIQHWSGSVSPTLNANVDGYQVGHDLYAALHDSGSTQRLGVFVGHARLDGRVKGFAGGFEDRRTGKLKLEGDNLGLYWTLADPTGWYIDAVAMGSRLDGHSRSERGISIDTTGHVATLSLESGYPLALPAGWVLEPQAQVISRRITLDGQHDGISSVAFDTRRWNAARVGARLERRQPVKSVTVQPFASANLWHDFAGSDSVRFNNKDRINTSHRATRADLGVGLITRLSASMSLHLSADYSADLNNHDSRGVAGNLGVIVDW
jgi:outer membrane autotransporter protein